MPQKNLNAVTYMLSLWVSLSLLSSSGGQEQQYPFEIVKNHIWGDKVNGCDYQKIAFHNNSLAQKNSKEMISRIKSKNPDFKIEENEIFKADKIESNKYNFKLYFKKDDNIYTYKVIDNTLILYSTDENEKLVRNGGVYPTDFVICN